MLRSGTQSRARKVNAAPEEAQSFLIRNVAVAADFRRVRTRRARAVADRTAAWRCPRQIAAKLLVPGEIRERSEFRNRWFSAMFGKQ